MERIEILKQIKEKLESDGYGGLYYHGECGCEIDDLAPCGECNKEQGEDWINDCNAGYKHIDPRCGNFVLSGSKEPPTPEEFDSAFANC